VAIAWRPAPRPDHETRAGATVPRRRSSSSASSGEVSAAEGGLVAHHGGRSRRGLHALGARDAGQSSRGEGRRAPRGEGTRPLGPLEGVEKPITTWRAGASIASWSWPPERDRTESRSEQSRHGLAACQGGALLDVLGVGEAGRIARGPASTTTSIPALTRGARRRATTATRVSPGQVSFSTLPSWEFSAGPRVLRGPGQCHARAHSARCRRSERGAGSVGSARCDSVASAIHGPGGSDARGSGLARGP